MGPPYHYSMMISNIFSNPNTFSFENFAFFILFFRGSKFRLNEDLKSHCSKIESMNMALLKLQASKMAAVKSVSVKSTSISLQWLNCWFFNCIWKKEEKSNRQWSNLNASRKSFNVSNLTPINLQAEKTTSLKVVCAMLAPLRLQSTNSHSKKCWLSKYELEKSQPSKKQFSYSALGSGVLV